MKINKTLLFSILVIILFLLITACKNEEGKNSSGGSVSGGGGGIKYWSWEQQQFDDEVEAAGGYDNYVKMEKAKACFDACNPPDDPLCEYCAQLSR